MSLTSHLRDKNSPVRKFILESSPHLAVAGTRGEEGRTAASTLGFDEVMAHDLVLSNPGTAEEWRSLAGTAGTAFDYRVRMMLSPFEPTNTAAADGLRYLSSLESTEALYRQFSILLEGFELAEQFMVSGDDADLDRAAVLLAWCENIYRIGVTALTGSLGELVDASESGAELVSKIPALLLADIKALRTGSAPQIKVWQQQVVAGERLESNPELEGSQYVGGADADWLISTTLIDCKTTKRLDRPWIRESLFQLLGYALLDFDDYLGIRNVAIWLPRRRLFQTWSLDALLGGDAEKILLKLRRKFIHSLKSL